jgi:catechol 2,3-dioxygenase-like lactoylglutathione lyase family enzyme
MKPRVTVITLGVDDLERSLKFYRDGLGFPTRGIVGQEFEHGAVAFFDLQHGVKLAIWPRTSLAHEAKVPLGSRSATEFALGHNVGSKAEVDAVMAQAQRSCATITDPPHDAFWGGYTGSFQDPDGHVWEVAWNPDGEITD